MEGLIIYKNWRLIKTIFHQVIILMYHRLLEWDYNRIIICWVKLGYIKSFFMNF